MDPELYIRFRLSYSPATFAYIAQRTGLSPSNRVLDLACGPGVVTKVLLKQAGLVWGLDQSMSMLRGAQGYLGSRGSLLLTQGNGEGMPFASGSFNLVTIGQAIHWFHLEKLYPELKRVLRPGGWLAVLSRYPSPETPFRYYVECLTEAAKALDQSKPVQPHLTEAKAVGNLLGLEAAGFKDYQRQVIAWDAETPLDTFIEGYTQRAESRGFSPQTLAWFETNLSTWLASACPDRIVRERYFDYVLTAQKE